MKFDNHKYWKHEDCMDVFISVNSIPFDDDGRHAILSVTWCVQGTASWWTCEVGRAKITPENYEKWRPYEPKGKSI